MSLTVIYRETAQRDLARLRRRDEAGFSSARRAILALARDPSPASAVPWGRSGFCRLHDGNVRVLYEVDEEAGAIYVVSVAVIA